MTTAARKAVSSVGRRRGGKVRASVAGRFSLVSLMDERGAVNVDDIAKTFGMSKAQLADTAGLAREVLQKASRRDGPKAQSACARDA